jgi:ribosomal protein L15
VPCLYRIKNAKREKYAKDLIAKLCKKYGLEWDGNRNDNYYLPYESTDELLAKELVKEVGEKKSDVPKTKEEYKKEVESSQRSMISAGEADRLISNQAALCCLADDTGGKPFKGNAEEINIDKIAAYFNAGEVVNLASLKKKGLVPHSTKAIKICARGTLSKPLKVEAQDYSLVAVKMILISGGKAKKVK